MLMSLRVNNRQSTSCIFSFIYLFYIDDADQLTAENTDDSNHDSCEKIVPLREQDRFLPIANVAKIMKKAIPETGKVNNKVGDDCGFKVDLYMDLQIIAFRLPKMRENACKSASLNLLVL